MVDVVDSYMIITYHSGKTEQIDNYMSHGSTDDDIIFYVAGGSNVSRSARDIKHVDIYTVIVPPVAVQHFNIDVKIKQDNKMEQEKFDELVEWFKGRFKDIKTITRVVRADKVIKDTHGEPTGVVRKGGIFTTVVLKDGRAGVVEVQKISEDNPELGVLWAYTKAKENEKKDSTKNAVDRMFRGVVGITNPCSEIAMSSGIMLCSGSRTSNDDSYMKLINKFIAESKY